MKTENGYEIQHDMMIIIIGKIVEIIQHNNQLMESFGADNNYLSDIIYSFMDVIALDIMELKNDDYNAMEIFSLVKHMTEEFDSENAAEAIYRGFMEIQKEDKIRYDS